MWEKYKSNYPHYSLYFLNYDFNATFKVRTHALNRN